MGDPNMGMGMNAMTGSQMGHGGLDGRASPMMPGMMGQNPYASMYGGMPSPPSMPGFGMGAGTPYNPGAYSNYGMPSYGGAASPQMPMNGAGHLQNTERK